MLRRAALLATLLSLLTAAAAGARRSAQAAGQASSVEALDRQLSGYFRAAGTQTSGLVVDLDTGRTLFSLRASVPRLPASVEKLYTTTAALFAFGPGATLATTVYGVGHTNAAGQFTGTLYLKGGGDPTFGDAGFDGVMYGTGATVQRLVASLRAAGIRAVHGTIVGDESKFDALRGGPDSGYAANLETEGQLDALSYDAGFTDRSETALQGHPTLWAAQAFAAALSAGGIRVAQGTRVYAGRTPPQATALASVTSPPMATLIRLTDQPSDNFFAETLVKDLGASFGSGGSTAAGAAVVRRVIATRLGLHPRLDDGSGLSRYDRTTAAQVVSLLAQMRDDAALEDALAVAGVSGTMRGEMVGTRAVGNCRGKTGTLHDVANLVGYCTAAGGDRLAFAFLLNGLTSADYGHALEDLMGEALADYRGPTGGP
jgi:D-alanyl-D-alanine carboxypeptidase/D-alanyl-D-alanine-endopeptidase (penicillin-binding protein 4)